MAKAKESKAIAPIAEKPEWLKKLEAKAKDARSMVQLGVPRFTHKNGVFKRDNELVKDNTVIGVVLDVSLSNEWFSKPYVEGQSETPDCYSFGQTAAEMKPHPESAMPQSPSCVTCPKNEYRSAANGKGKACKNNARILVAARPDDPTEYAQQEKRQISIPPTSLANWSNYLGAVQDACSSGSVSQAVTEIKPAPRTKGSGHMLTFKQVGTLELGELEEVFKVAEASQGLLTQPFPKLGDDDEVKPKVNERSKRKLA